jgi:hypothetical protein
MACSALAAICDGHNRIVMGRHRSLGALLLVVERAALEMEEGVPRAGIGMTASRGGGEGGGDFVAGTCALISRLGEIKELRDKLVEMGVIHPLVALVLLSDQGLYSKTSSIS